MKKDVMITIKTDVSANGDSDSIELSVKGTLLVKDDCLYLGYKETSEMGVGDNNVLITVKDNDKFTVTRSGDTSSQLNVELSRRNLCSYATAYGNIMIGIYGKKITSQLKNECDADVLVEYSIDADMALLSENRLSINIRECAN